MPQQKTTWIVNSIKGLKLSHKTGILIIRRGVGSHLEEGSIEFRYGQIINATIGRKRGIEAINYLTSWTHCQFSFENISGLETQPPSTPFPTFGGPQASKGQQTDSFTTFRPQPISADANRPQRSLQSRPSDYTTDDPEIPYSARPLDYGLHLIESRGLTRSHKRLFLLINGKRSVQELARLLKRAPKEIYELLYDMERTEIIKIPSFSQR